MNSFQIALNALEKNKVDGKAAVAIQLCERVDSLWEENEKLKAHLRNIHAMVSMKDWGHNEQSVMQQRILANIPQSALLKA